jgi:hypothetical protein
MNRAKKGRVKSESVFENDSGRALELKKNVVGLSVKKFWENKCRQKTPLLSGLIFKNKKKIGLTRWLSSNQAAGLPGLLGLAQTSLLAECLNGYISQDSFSVFKPREIRQKGPENTIQGHSSSTVYSFFVRILSSESQSSGAAANASSPLILSRSILEMRKVTTRRGLNSKTFPVWGLRPSRVFLRLTWNLPKLLIKTSSSPARVILMMAMSFSTASRAVFRDSSAVSKTAPIIRSLVTVTFQAPDGRGLGASVHFRWKRPNFTYLGAQVNILRHPASSGGRKIKNQGETCGSLARVPADSIFLSIKPKLLRLNKILYYFSRILWNPKKYGFFYRNSLKKIDVIPGRIPVFINLEHFENCELI